MLQAPFLQIEPTTRCNFTCGFCCGRYMPQEDIEWQTFIDTLDTFPELQHVELQGEGESLLHKQFYDMVDELRRRDIKISFISNGSLISPKHADRLLDAGIDKISVSIESPDPAEFKRIRGGKLDKVIRNLEHLVAEKQRRGLAKPVVGFSVTVLQSTIDHLDEVFALYDRLQLDGGITVQPLQQMDSYARHYGDDIAVEELDATQSEDIFSAFFSNARLRAIDKSKSAIGGFYAELSKGWRPAKRACPYLDRGLYVNRTGHVTACCMIKDTDSYGFGKIGETPKESMLEARESMRRQLATGEVPEACGGCALANFAVMSTPGLMAFGARGLWKRLFG